LHDFTQNFTSVPIWEKQTAGCGVARSTATAGALPPCSAKQVQNSGTLDPRRHNTSKEVYERLRWLLRHGLVSIFVVATT